MGGTGVIDNFLSVFTSYIDSGFGLLGPDVAYLTTFLVTIDIVLAGLFWALSQNTDVIAGLLKKVLYVGFFAFILKILTLSIITNTITKSIKQQCYIKAVLRRVGVIFNKNAYPRYFG